jgi:hypothetical protein
MNSVSNHPLTIAKFLLLLIAPWLMRMPAAWADDAIGLSARAVNVLGQARYHTNHATWNVLRTGTELRAGSVVQTAAKDSAVDISLARPDAGSRCTIHIYSNSMLNLAGLEAKTSGSLQTGNISLGLAQGMVRVTLGGALGFEYEIIGGAYTVRLKIPPNKVNSQGTVFLFDQSGRLTVLKGIVKASGHPTAPEKEVNAGEQLRTENGEVKRLPREAPELKLDL